MLDISTLGSISASLDDLNTRLSEIADNAGENDEAAIDLLEVERLLRTANRRLTKILRQATS